MRTKCVLFSLVNTKTVIVAARGRKEVKIGWWIKQVRVSHDIRGVRVLV